MAKEGMWVAGAVVGMMVLGYAWGGQVGQGEKSPPGTSKRYITSFSLTENPISEGGGWAGGQSAGGNLWGDVETKGRMAFGVSEPTEFGDPTAILRGSWATDQSASGVVKIEKRSTGECCREVEVRLRTTIIAKSITGYEAYCSVMPEFPYCHIARWNGPNGSYCNIESETAKIYAADGDVLMATVQGTKPTIITLYKNGTQIVQANDMGQDCSPGGAAGPFTSGNPGIGFYDNKDNNWSYFGLSRFTAQDGIEAPSKVDAKRTEAPTF